MLTRLLTSKIRIRLLAWLMFNQEKSFHLRDLARRTDSTPIHAAKELDNLLRLNLVKKNKKGNLVIYSINKNCIFLEELKSIFLKTEYFGELIRKELDNKAKFCFIFGSFAKGSENESSDIDLFIVSKIKEQLLLSTLKKLEETTGREINYILWDEDTFCQRAQGGHHLLRTINAGKIIMLIGDENEFRNKIR